MPTQRYTAFRKFVQVPTVGPPVGSPTMPMTRLGRAYGLAGQLHDERSRAEPDWEQIAADSAEWSASRKRWRRSVLREPEFRHHQERPAPPPGGQGR
jgi:hypothetical protein